MISPLAWARPPASILAAGVFGLVRRLAISSPKEPPRGCILHCTLNESVQKPTCTRDLVGDPRRRVCPRTAENYPRDWSATIDTGFNGDLELPDALREPLNAQYVGRATAALAGGQSVEEDLYLVDFPFDGRIVQAEATFVSGSRILIGTRLLREYSLQINFVSRTVQLERA